MFDETSEVGVVFTLSLARVRPECVILFEKKYHPAKYELFIIDEV